MNKRLTAEQLKLLVCFAPIYQGFSRSHKKKSAFLAIFLREAEIHISVDHARKIMRNNSNAQTFSTGAISWLLIPSESGSKKHQK